MLRTLVALALIAAALPGTALACGIAPAPGAAATQANRQVAPGLAVEPVQPSDGSRCVSWYRPPTVVQGAAARRDGPIRTARDATRR